MIMGKFQAMNKYFTIFLALFACDSYSLLIHGREIKPLTQHSNSPQPLKASVKNVHVPTPSSEQKDDSTVIPKYVASARFGNSGESYTNGFRPTTPGNSPGVGHRKFAAEDKDMKGKVVAQSPDVKVYVTEGTESGFKPTNPGHSPGVGHSQQNEIGQ